MSDPVTKIDPVVVTFTQHHPPYGAGDSAGFDKDQAKDLVKRKLAVLASTSFLERAGMTKSRGAEELEKEFSEPAKTEAPNPSTWSVPVEPKVEAAPAVPPSKPEPMAEAKTPPPGQSASHGRKGRR